MMMNFNEALEVAKGKYPHKINHYEEYERYFVFEHVDGSEHVGGTASPIVIRKSDGAALNYEPLFFNMSEDAEDIGELVSEGEIG